MAGTYDISCDRGSTFILSMTFRDSNADLVDLTGYSASMSIKTAPTDTTPLLYLQMVSDDSTGISFGPGNGKITVTITAESMEGIEPGSYKYDLLLSQAGTNLYTMRLLKGKFKVLASITRITGD